MRPCASAASPCKNEPPPYRDESLPSRVIVDPWPEASASRRCTGGPTRPMLGTMTRRQGSVQGSDGTEVSYELVGNGPALVLTNGLTTTSTFWKYLQPRWAPHHSVLTWDFPGHGKSAPAR